nr:nuclease sensitive element binding protein [Hymenolepis microstoma]
MTAEVAQPTAEHQAVAEKKNFDILKILAEKVSGTVKWFSINRHYGFIQRDDNKEDVFVHRTAITASKLRYPNLKNGESVEFNVVETPSGINAASVTGPNGQNVQGIRFFRRRYRSSQANGGDGHSSMNGGTSQASGDAEGSRFGRGGGRMRRGRRNYRGPSQNGDGGEPATAEVGEQTGDGEVNSRPPRQQRQRRYRGGRGGGRPRSTSNRQAGATTVEGEESDAGAEDFRPPARRGGRGGRRGGGRFRRGARNGGGPQRGDGGEGADENNVAHGPKIEAKQVEENSSSATEQTELNEVTQSSADNLESKMDNLSLNEKQVGNSEGTNGEETSVKAVAAEGSSD